VSKVESFEELVMWKEAIELVGPGCQTFPHSNEFKLWNQMQQTSISVMKNISERFERSSDADFARILFNSKALAGEARSMIYVAPDLEYITHELANELINRSGKLSGSISNFIKYLKASSLKYSL
jgi:four helix bundle protein